MGLTSRVCKRDAVCLLLDQEVTLEMVQSTYFNLFYGEVVELVRFVFGNKWLLNVSQQRHTESSPAVFLQIKTSNMIPLWKESDILNTSRYHYHTLSTTAVFFNSQHKLTRNT